MALARGRGASRLSTSIWPGFVDAMTALLMVLMFVITIFMVVQSVLRDTVDRQESELGTLSEQVAGLTSILAITRQERETAQSDLSSARDRLSAFEDQVAGLIAAREAEAERAGAAEAELAETRQRLGSTEEELAATAQRLSTAEATLDTTANSLSRAEQALASARTEVDAQAEAAREAAARREALQALVEELRADQAETAAALGTAQQQLDQTGSALSEAEEQRLAEAEAARLLRERLAESEAELTAMTLSLEESRREAEETLTLLAAARAAREELDSEAQAALRAAAENASEAERQAALLAAAREELAGEQAASTEAQRRVALLNEQVAALNGQLASIQAALNASESDSAAAEVELEELGQQLNAALLRASEEQRQRLALEEAERVRLEEEAADLARYRSEFFGSLREILEGRDEVEVVGDRFVFQSEVLFGQGEATLSAAGRQSVARVSDMLIEIADTIPPEIDWVIRVDGHTDSVPLSGQGRYRDNWELSQARALAVVRYMVDDLGFPAGRLAPTGFADTRPVAPEDSAEGRARNRRIELKLTER
ncbi:chemotaxis protein MotB [Paracoccus isoporae]|uniref:Chemotaxis protein MotB n=1 Tax=Paracoccus isoporae TaxID=591205 RepID=A0A1G7BJ55_9RHOB|nr:peptidoglycan -binding protein [Paracoccus isoporae]SDE26285.1 chemotaxis protein MotB [Paracoccus isoporae]